MLLAARSSSSTSPSSYYESLIMYCFLIATTLIFIASLVKGDPSSSSSSSSEDMSTQHQDHITTNWYTIEGKVLRPDRLPTPGHKQQQQHPQHHRSSSYDSGSDWASQIQILVNGGEHIGYAQEDGSFKIHGLTSGSHVIDVVHPQVYYESARVDITSKGKIRARKVNHLQPSLVTHMIYPLRLTPIGHYRYFQIREQWRITDVLFSPMVLMMVLPLILIVILPKMMSDPETRKEMESVTLPKYEMPEMSEMLTSFFGGGSSASNNDNGGGSERKKAIRAKKAN